MSEIELKACPFCGAKPETGPWQKHGLTVQCSSSLTDCPVCPGYSHYEPKGAVAAWNIRAPQWQPIESAPKGQEVLVWRPDQGVFIAMIATPDMVMPERDIEECCLPEDFEEWYCEAWGWLEDDLRPTRWMPKPAEPEVEG